MSENNSEYKEIKLTSAQAKALFEHWNDGVIGNKNDSTSKNSNSGGCNMLFGKEKITKEVYIDGMSCMHCAAKVEKALASVSGVTDAKVDLVNKKAVVKLKKDIDNATLKATVEDLGYNVTDIK